MPCNPAPCAVGFPMAPSKPLPNPSLERYCRAMAQSRNNAGLRAAGFRLTCDRSRLKRSRRVKVRARAIFEQIAEARLNAFAGRLKMCARIFRDKSQPLEARILAVDEIARCCGWYQEAGIDD